MITRSCRSSFNALPMAAGPSTDADQFLICLLDFKLFARRIAVEPCGTPCFERACGTIAVLEKLEVSNLIPLKTSQEGIWRCNLPPGHVRLVGERAEKSDTVPLLNSVGDLEVECFPAALDRHKDIGQ